VIKTVRSIAVALSATALLSGVASSQSVDLTGAGATFPYPIYSKWFSDYAQSTGVKINYQSIGSGGGIRQLSEQTVDFGASDGPMSDQELASAKGGPVLHFPTVMGAVVITYNVPGLTRPLNLTGDAIADIFAGKITKWNDAQIVAQNRGVALPNSDILVVHRSDGSGTTYIFSDYLTSVSPSWSSSLGKGKEIKWPVGLGGKGNEGVAGQVKQTPGSIGYVELAYAKQSPLCQRSQRRWPLHHSFDRVGDRRGRQHEAPEKHRLPHFDRERARQGFVSDLVDDLDPRVPESDRPGQGREARELPTLGLQGRRKGGSIARLRSASCSHGCPASEQTEDDPLR